MLSFPSSLGGPTALLLTRRKATRSGQPRTQPAEKELAAPVLLLSSLLPLLSLFALVQPCQHPRPPPLLFSVPSLPLMGPPTPVRIGPGPRATLEPAVSRATNTTPTSFLSCLFPSTTKSLPHPGQPSSQASKDSPEVRGTFGDEPAARLWVRAGGERGGRARERGKTTQTDQQPDSPEDLSERDGWIVDDLPRRYLTCKVIEKAGREERRYVGQKWCPRWLEL